MIRGYRPRTGGPEMCIPLWAITVALHVLEADGMKIWEALQIAISARESVLRSTLGGLIMSDCTTCPVPIISVIWSMSVWVRLLEAM